MTGGDAVVAALESLGVEHVFMGQIVAAFGPGLSGRILETASNAPVRNLYRDNGFTRGEDGVWRLETMSSSLSAA